MSKNEGVQRPGMLRSPGAVCLTLVHTWKKAMETGDPTWAAYPPMTKAAVR